MGPIVWNVRQSRETELTVTYTPPPKASRTGALAFPRSPPPLSIASYRHHSYRRRSQINAVHEGMRKGKTTDKKCKLMRSVTSSGGGSTKRGEQGTERARGLSDGTGAKRLRHGHDRVDERTQARHSEKTRGRTDFVISRTLHTLRSAPIPTLYLLYRQQQVAQSKAFEPLPVVTLPHALRSSVVPHRATTALGSNGSNTK